MSLCRVQEGEEGTVFQWKRTTRRPNPRKKKACYSTRRESTKLRQFTATTTTITTTLPKRHGMHVL